MPFIGYVKATMAVNGSAEGQPGLRRHWGGDRTFDRWILDHLAIDGDDYFRGLNASNFDIRFALPGLYWKT